MDKLVVTHAGGHLRHMNRSPTSEDILETSRTLMQHTWGAQETTTLELLPQDFENKTLVLASAHATMATTEGTARRRTQGFVHSPEEADGGSTCDKKFMPPTRIGRGGGCKRHLKHLTRA